MRTFFALLACIWAFEPLSARAQGDIVPTSCLLKAAGLRLEAEEKTKFLKECSAAAATDGQSTAKPKSYLLAVMVL